MSGLPDVSGFAVREVAGDNEHWHWYIRTTKRGQPIRVALTRSVPELRGNGGYSLKECSDNDGYWRYILKGEAPEVPAEIAWNHGIEWTQDKFQELHEAYWVQNRLTKKKRVGSVQDHTVDEAKRTAVPWDDRRALTRIYIKELVARTRPINTFAVRSSVRVIQCILCPDDEALEEVINQALV